MSVDFITKITLLSRESPYRLEKEKSILDALWGQLDEQKPRKESRFETAVKYTKNQKDMLMTYLTYLLDHCPSVICLMNSLRL